MHLPADSFSRQKGHVLEPAKEKLFLSHEIISTPRSCRSLLRKRADIGRMGKLQINERVFDVQFDLDYEGGPDIVCDPIGSGQRFGRAIGGVPEKFPCFSLDFRGIKFKDLTIVSLD